jgi:hypothetical protein
MRTSFEFFLIPVPSRVVAVLVGWVGNELVVVGEKGSNSSIPLEDGTIGGCSGGVDRYCG